MLSANTNIEKESASSEIWVVMKSKGNCVWHPTTSRVIRGEK